MCNHPTTPCILEHTEMGVEDVFKLGPLPTQTLTISQGKGEQSPPKALMVVVPRVQGDYPVLLFLHGYLLVNSFYTQLLQHIASHGYITIAPQMYSIACANASEEIDDAVAVTEWLRTELREHLPENVQPDLTKLVIAGHSRGGKVAFAVALGRSTIPPSSPYVALLGIDPVEGTEPQILSKKDESLSVNIPTLVIGSGLGPEKGNIFFPACAPAGNNHVDFFRECCPPAYHFTAVEYGHMDFLDDKTGGVKGTASYCICKNGTEREPMRRFSGGVMVAFLNAWLKKEVEVLDKLVADPSLIPVNVFPPECHLLQPVLI